MNEFIPAPEREILLVEDNPGDVRLMREALREVPYLGRLHTVDSVDRALDFLLQREAFAAAARPDVVLLDLNLPRRHGLDLLDEMRGHDTIAGIPVIVLTSSASEEDRRRSYESAAAAFVTKPQSLDAYVDLHVVATWASQPPNQEQLP
jgi:two-component system, chemotaxis family, response regulator Rcp1